MAFSFGGPHGGPLLKPLSFHELGVLRGRVDAVGGTRGRYYHDRPAVLQRSELLQLFGLLQRGLRPRRELEQEAAPISIDAQMQIIRWRPGGSLRRTG